MLINNTPNAKGILTGKLFEYMASGRPILCIGPEDGDAAHIINETGSGTTVDYEEKEKMKSVIKDYYQKYMSGSLVSMDNPVIEKYSRKVLAGDLTALLNQTQA